MAETSFKNYAANQDSAFNKAVDGVQQTIKKAKEAFQTAGEAVKEIAQHNGHSIPSFMDCWKAVCAEADGKKAIRAAQFQGFISTIGATFSNVTSKVGYGFSSVGSDIKDIVTEAKTDGLGTGMKVATAGAVGVGIYDYLSNKDDKDDKNTQQAGAGDQSQTTTSPEQTMAQADTTNPESNEQDNDYQMSM